MYPGIILGNGATVKKKDYLKKIGAYGNILFILNAGGATIEFLQDNNIC